MHDDDAPHLKKTLGPWMIWGLGVGYVISGMYCGWNLGLPEGGPIGLLVATGLVTVLYLCFVLGYAELSCMLPQAGGAFVYARRALGPTWGFVAGFAQVVEFAFAPPAIASAIGQYFALFPNAPPAWLVSVAAYLLFTAINVWGVKLSAQLELVVTVLAVAELLLFAGVTLPRFSWETFAADGLPHGLWGIGAAVPFAIWFYLAIEGIANVAEEARDPRRDLPRGFFTAMGTLVVLAALVLFGATGVAGWRAVVYPPGSTEPSDSPLPLALSHVVGVAHPLYTLLIGIGLLGLVASFHGILLAAGRATFEMGRAGFLPRGLGALSTSRGTPWAALLANLVVGLVALLTGKTGDIILVSVFGALTLYVTSMVSLFVLRRREPALPRPYRAPGYPVVPAIALVLAAVALVVMALTNPRPCAVFVALLVVGTSAFRVVVRRPT